MSHAKPPEGLPKIINKILVRGRPLKGSIILAACLVTASSCEQASSPLEKAFEAVGGKQALLDLKSFSYEATGERFEPEEGATPTADPEKASAYTLAVSADVENDRVSFDWEWEIIHPLRGQLAYRDVLDGDLGFRAGNDSVFNPPGVTTEAAIPSQRIGGLRRELRLLNPQLYLRAAAVSEDVASIKPDIELDGRTHHVIEVSDVAVPVELFVDAESGLVSKLQTLQNDHIWGDVVTEVSYGDWSTAEGSPLMIPQDAELAVADTTLRRETRTNVMVNLQFSADAFSIPDEPATQVDGAAMERGERSSQYHKRWQAMGIPADTDQTAVTATALAGDTEIQHMTGGSHHSLAVKMGDGIVVVEPPLNEARSRAVLNKIEELWPGVPVTHLILTHSHFDHMGGIRTYAAIGATIVTSALNRTYVEEALNSPHTLVPDELAAVAEAQWSIEEIPLGEEFSFEAGNRSIKAKHAQTVHSDDMLVVYLPEIRALFNSDLYFPGMAPSQPLPPPFGAWAQGLRDRIPELGWDIQMMIAGHAGIGTISDLHSHFEE
jgi:glyoxylase-like metal-dependent hydrolase (beta-lactamase superfamily II)